MESQTEGDLTDLGDLSVHGPGSVDVKKEIGKGKDFGDRFLLLKLITVSYFIFHKYPNFPLSSQIDDFLFLCMKLNFKHGNGKVIEFVGHKQ